jgi:thioredoxin-dependent peroxiredoxin
MALKVGDLAPDFTLTDSSGETVRLADLRGKKVVLYFFTMPGGNNCTRMALGYRERAAGFAEKNAVIFGMNDKDAQTAQDWIQRESLPFSVLLDTDRSVGIAYGMSAADSERYVARPDDGRRPAVVIDEEGRIAAWEQDMNTVDQIEELLFKL